MGIWKRIFGIQDNPRPQPSGRRRKHQPHDWTKGEAAPDIKNRVQWQQDRELAQKHEHRP